MQKPNSSHKGIAQLLLLSITLFFTTHSAHAADTQVGSVTNVTLTGSGNQSANFWINNGGVAAVTPLARDVVRVQYYFAAPLWSKEEPMIAKATNQWAAVGATYTDNGSTYTISTPQLDVVVTKSPFKVDFKDKSGYYLSQDVATYFNSTYNYTAQSGFSSGDYKLKCIKTLPTSQAIFGLGEFGGPLNRRGREMEVWTQGTGTYHWGEFQNPVYMNMPVFYGVQPASGGTPAFVYGVFFNNPCRPLFSFASTKSGAGNLSFEAGDGQMDYFFFGGGTNHTMAGVIDRYSELTGRPTMLPKWAFGYQISRFSYLDQNTVTNRANEATAANIPLDAIHLDIDYMDVNHDQNISDGQLHQLSFNSNYPNPGQMAANCAAKGVKIVPLIEPWLEPGDPMYGEANGLNHFIKDNSSVTVTRSIYVGNVSWFDFSSTAMRQWWGGKIGNWLNSFPFAGIWNDLTEPEGGDQIPYNGLLWCDGNYGLSTTDSRRQMSNERNYFGLRSSQCSYEAMLTKYPNKRPFVLSRSGNTGLQRYAISWSGDTTSEPNYRRITIPFGLSSMISGAAWYGHDLGGFDGNPTGEQITRWHEFGSMLPYFREHASGRNSAIDREPWKYADPYQTYMRNIIQFRYKLMPYLYSLAYNATQTGEPMNTPTAFKFYGDSNTASQNNYDFMVGDYLLAAPIYNDGTTTRQVYLPYANGVSWYYYPATTPTKYCGGSTATVSAPVGTLPLFVRSGAIIPMGPSMQYMNQFTPGSLDINCWPLGNSSFTMYEDAGEGWDFTNSTGRVQTTFTSSRTDTNWNFTIGARQGTYNPGHTNYFVYCYNPQVVTSVKINNTTINSNSFTAVAQSWLVTSDGKVGIKVTDDGTQKDIRVDWTGTPPSVCSSPVGSPNDLGLPGTWNGWTNDFVSPWLLGTISPPGTPNGVNWYTNSIAVGTDIPAGTYQFKLRRGHDWASNWGFSTAANVITNVATTLTWNSSTNAQIVLQSGAYYSFRVLEPTPISNATIVVMKTAAKPVGVTFNGISPSFPNSNDAVTVSITLSAPKSAEEHIYVRYTTTNWASSQFVEATGSGTSYSAILPALPIGTTVKYYVLTTTNTGITHSTADVLTLSLDTNNGLNYTYTPATIPWPGFGYPSDPADNIFHWKEEAVIGNGYITAMLDQNGTVYDYYFPSVGVPAGTATANEGYRSAAGTPEWPPGCSQNNKEANGQMNLIAAMAGIAVTNGGNNTVYWLKNQNSTDYTEVGQRWTADDSDVVLTSNRLNVAGYDIKVQQYDFVPSEDAIPVNPIAGARSDGTRTNRAVHVKRILLTNNEATSKTINFYWDANFNIKGDNAYDTMSYEGTVGGTNYSAMVVYDNAGRVATGGWCDPNGYGGSPGTEYNPDFTPGSSWSKSNSVYFATVMKLVTNAVTGAGSPADGSWRDHTTTDNQEGWIGKKITIPAGQTVEMDVMTVGSWDTVAGATGTHAFWGRPMINWFYSNNMSNVQAATEGYWSNWVNNGVTVNFPDPAYDQLFKRSLIVSKLHADPVGGAVIAGMHNGAYPFVWPRDGVYAAITFDRTGHATEASAFYKWLSNAQRPAETWGAGYFFQKYTTDGKPVWRNPQVDETASVPWGMYYHYLATGDGAFLSNNWNMVYTAARASSETGTNDFLNLNFDVGTHLVWSWNVWEDVVDEHLYSNASVVRGLQDAANIADYVGQSVTAGVFRARATDIKGNGSQGLVKRINDHVESSDISHLGLVYPFEVFTPNDPLMTNVVEWLHGRQVSGGTNSFFDNIVESDPETAGMVRRYNHKLNGETDIYWNGGPWNLATAWYGMYYARWQDYVGGKSLVDTNKVLLDKIIAKLGPMGLAGEQIAVNSSEQKYPGFWLQTAWANTWESHSTFVDQIMMFLDYKPQTNNTCAFAPKLPTGWPSVKFNNVPYKNQRLDVTVTEGTFQTRADINKLTAGSLNYDVYLRIPAGNTPAMVITNGQYYVPAPADYDTATGRVHIKGPLNSAIGNNALIVTYGSSDVDGDGLSDFDEINSVGTSPINPDTDGDLMTDGYEFNNGLNPNVNDASLDKDGDGQSNLAEFLAGTAANDAGSALRVTSVVPESSNIRVTWKAGGGKTNILQFTAGNGGGYATNFTDLPPQIVLPCCGDVTTNQLDFGGATNIPSRFYRIRLVP